MVYGIYHMLELQPVALGVADLAQHHAGLRLHRDDMVFLAVALGVLFGRGQAIAGGENLRLDEFPGIPGLFDLLLKVVLL